MSGLAIHPVAALFPMLTDAELQELAADIKANGLRFPIVCDKEGKMLVDGRNRLAACEIASVKPAFRNLDGEDPVAFIISANIARRNLNKGQRAILLAKIYPEAEKAHRGHKSEQAKLLETKGFSNARLSQAREIVRWMPDLADKVLAERMQFDDALEAAHKKRVDETTELDKLARIEREAPDLRELAGRDLDEAIGKLEARKAEAARLNVIRETAPDLIARVNDAMITVDEALAIQSAREEAKLAAQKGAVHRLELIMTRICLMDRSPEETAAELMGKIDPELWPQDSEEVLSADRLDQCGRMLLACAAIFRARDQ